MNGMNKTYTANKKLDYTLNQALYPEGLLEIAGIVHAFINSTLIKMGCHLHASPASYTHKRSME
jgi:hypothetical protein